MYSSEGNTHSGGVQAGNGEDVILDGKLEVIY